MARTAEAMLTEALDLSQEARARLARSPIASLDESEPDGVSPAEAIADDRMDEVLAIIDRLQTGACV